MQNACILKALNLLDLIHFLILSLLPGAHRQRLTDLKKKDAYAALKNLVFSC